MDNPLSVISFIISALFFNLSQSVDFVELINELNAPRTQKELTAALDYIRSLPVGTKYYVMPTNMKIYEFVEEVTNRELEEYVNNYIDEINPISHFISDIDFIQISIFTYNGSKNAIKTYMKRTKFNSAYTSYISSLNIFQRPCESVQFVDRETWATGGLILLDTSRIRDKKEREECIYSGLDTMNGFPSDGKFDYKSFPSHAVRKIVMAAVTSCSKTQRPNEKDVERSRDGISALPTRSCVLGKIDNEIAAVSLGQ